MSFQYHTRLLESFLPHPQDRLDRQTSLWGWEKRQVSAKEKGESRRIRHSEGRRNTIVLVLRNANDEEKSDLGLAKQRFRRREVKVYGDRLRDAKAKAHEAGRKDISSWIRRAQSFFFIQVPGTTWVTRGRYTRWYYIPRKLPLHYP